MLFILVCQSDWFDSGMLIVYSSTDLMPTNILLELENPDNAVSQYLADNPQRTSINGNTITPLREVIKTPLISEMDKPHIRIIDFGVGELKGRPPPNIFSFFIFKFKLTSFSIMEEQAPV